MSNPEEWSSCGLLFASALPIKKAMHQRDPKAVTVVGVTVSKVCAGCACCKLKVSHGRSFYCICVPARHRQYRACLVAISTNQSSSTLFPAVYVLEATPTILQSSGELEDTQAWDHPFRANVGGITRRQYLDLSSTLTTTPCSFLRLTVTDT